jgi:hypothetical protein
MRLSPDRQYLVGPTGSPVFVNGDTAWSLMAQPTDPEVLLYLDDRKAKGFNAVIANHIEHKFAANAPANAAGQPPFTGAPFSTPNEAYFARVDWILDQAAQRGITLFLAPLYLGYDCGDEGWCGEAEAASARVMRDYGRYLGQRYARFPNIVWLIGGDTNPFAHAVADKVRQVVAGIEEHDPDHLMTAHSAPEESAQDNWGTPRWLDLNTVYTYSASGTQAKTYTEYRRAKALPLLLLESAYAHEHGATPRSRRTQAYQAVLWGARVGQFFGNCPLWSFSAPAAASFCAGGDWHSELGSEGSTTVARVGDLMRSRRHWLMQPDHAHEVMTAGYESDATLAATARASDGSTVIAYLPTPRKVTIDLRKVSGSAAHAWWWDPRTNMAVDGGVWATTGPQEFAPPDAGGAAGAGGSADADADDNDIVLVIDDASAPLPAPGQPVDVTAALPPLNLQAR